MTFDEILEKLNSLDFSNNKTYFACDRNNPQSYMEVSASLEMHNDRQFVNTEFKVFNDGVQQKCDVFPHGKFTHFSKADGSNSTEQGSEHWDRMKSEMKEKGGFGDDMLIFPDLQSYQNFVATGQIEQPAVTEKQPIITEKPPVTEEKAVKQQVSPEAEQLFENFKAVETETNLKIAKQQDIIDILTAKIEDTVKSQNRQNQTVAACDTVLQSNAYPTLNPLISAFSENTKKSAEKKNNKIKNLKKKIKKAEKKIKRLKQKQQKNELLKGFISSLFDKNADKSAYVIGMQALKEDSQMRAEKTLDKIERKLEKAKSKLAGGNLNNTETVKLKACIKKLEGKKSELEKKINNLTELDQSLNKLAKTELLGNQFEEIKEVTIQNAANSTTISEAVDNITSSEVTSAVVKAVTGETKEAAKSVTATVSEDKAETPTEEKSEQKPVTSEQTKEQTAETTTEQKNPVAVSNKANLRKRDGLSEKEVTAILNAGIPIQAVKKPDNTITVVFDKSKTTDINQALENPRTTMKR
ncbi:MAG: hypothetical protein PUG48_07235 [Clostridia bacterium]|nr:hypothetical protein [Clostridia bacterium]